MSPRLQSHACSMKQASSSQTKYYASSTTRQYLYTGYTTIDFVLIEGLIT